MTVTEAAPDSRSWGRAAVLLAAAWWGLDLAVLRGGVPHPLDDSWEYLIVARSLLEGEGLRTSMIHPPLWHLRDAAGTVPLLIHGPLVPVLLVPFVLALGPAAPGAVAWLAAGLAVIAAVLTFRIAAARSGAAVGAAAAGLFTLSPLVVNAVHHDIALLAGAAFFAAALHARLGRPARPTVAGAALGLAHLARPEMLAALPLLVLHALRSPPPGGNPALRLLVGFGLVAAPWWVHQWIASGLPLFNLSSYLLIGYWSRDELSPLRDFALTPAQWPDVLRATLPRLPAKWLELFPHAMKRALLAPSGAVGWLAALGAALGLATRSVRGLAALAVALAAIPVAVQTLTLYDSRYLVPFLPLWCLGVGFAAERIASRARWARRPRLWIAALALLALPPALPALRAGAAEAERLRAVLARERAGLATLAVPAARRTGVPPLASDTPDFVAWETRRTVLWLTPAEHARLPRWDEPNPAGLPVRRSSGDTWFHPDERFPRAPGRERRVPAGRRRRLHARQRSALRPDPGPGAGRRGRRYVVPHGRALPGLPLLH